MLLCAKEKTGASFLPNGHRPHLGSMACEKGISWISAPVHLLTENPCTVYNLPHLHRAIRLQGVHPLKEPNRQVLTSISLVRKYRPRKEGSFSHGHTPGWRQTQDQRSRHPNSQSRASPSPYSIQFSLLGTDGRAETAGELLKAAPGEAFLH